MCSAYKNFYKKMPSTVPDSSKRGEEGLAAIGGNQMNSTITSLRAINQIVAIGSVDGILTTAALLRVIGNPETPMLCSIGIPETSIVFVQAFTVDKVDVTKWASARRVAFVDLAVNNREPAMTASFVECIRAAGHEIVAIIDEHNAEDWLKALGTFEGLVVEPISGKNTDRNSSGALLLSVLGNEADYQVRELCLAADAGDRMPRKSTYFYHKAPSGLVFYRFAEQG